LVDKTSLLWAGQFIVLRQSIVVGLFGIFNQVDYRQRLGQVFLGFYILLQFIDSLQRGWAVNPIFLFSLYDNIQRQYGGKFLFEEPDILVKRFVFGHISIGDPEVLIWKIPMILMASAEMAIMYTVTL